MKQLIMPAPADPPALHHWREYVFWRMQRIAILGALPVMILDLLRLVAQRAYTSIVIELLVCLAVLGSGLVGRIPYQWRTWAVLSTMLLFSSYLLLTSGLISAGRVYVVSCTFIAGLMLSRRSLLLVWLSGAATLLLSGLHFLGRPPAEIALLALRLTDPNTLLTNGLITLFMSAVVAFGAASLVGSLARSLRLAEQVIAERDQTNAELEQRVSTRTQELAEALAALQASEAKYKNLFQSLPVGVLLIDDQGGYAEYNPLARDFLGIDESPQPIRRASEVTRRLIRPDGSPLPLSEYPSVRTLHDRQPLSGLEVGVVIPQEAGEQLTWLSINVVPIDLPNYSSVVVFNDISARTQVEQALARQLAMQEAVAACSRILLQPALTAAEQKALLSNALSALRAALHANQLSLVQNFSDPEEGLCARIFTRVADERFSYDPGMLLLERLSWSAVPSDFVERMQAGKFWAGPIATLLPGNDLLIQTMHDLAVHSILSVPIFIERSWWGLLIFAHHQADRVWETYEFQLIQVAAGMFGTAIQRWQTEAELSLQLRYAEALARCSQVLLLPAESEAEHQRTLVAALVILCEAVDASRVHIFQPLREGVLLAGLRILADTYAPNIVPPIEPSFDQILDVPQAMIDALEAGQWFGGLASGRFSGNPQFQQLLDQNEVRTILMVPVIVGEAVWGVLSVADRTHTRDWDAPTIQLLRTATEMIATFQQSWEASQSLRAREHFIQRVTEATPDLIHVLDRATQRSLFANRSIAAQFGYSPEMLDEITFEMMSQLIHPDDYPHVLAFYDELILANDGTVGEQTFRVRTGDGRERWLLSRDLIFARDETGHPSQILSIVQDITTSKQTEQALAASETRLRALRDALPDLLFVVKADGTFLEFYAPRHTEILVPAALFLGRNLVDVLPPSIVEQAQRAIFQVSDAGGMELFEDTLTFEQRDLMFEIRVVSIMADEFLFMVRDITERRRTTRELLQAKEAAEAADRAKSTFLAHISHEIRTPLTAI
ncbi:MAG: PAS domain S-box protein, partial [Oscillochloris sp.]|nr:PAS domain S-box protein [Oscillochloris sp.]